MKRITTVVVTTIALATLSGCASEPEPTALESAWNTCEEDDSTEGANYDAEYDVITINGAGRQNDDGEMTPLGIEAWMAQICLTEAMDLPQHVEDHMGSTTSLQGRQEAEWDGIKGAWSYHPTSGFNATFEGIQDDE